VREGDLPIRIFVEIGADLNLLMEFLRCWYC